MAELPALFSASTQSFVFIGSLPCSVHWTRYQNIAANKMDSLHGLLEHRMARGAIPTHSSSNQISVRQPGSDVAESFMTHQAVHSWWSFSAMESTNMATPPSIEELML